jgi:hypothetical protein
VTGSSANWVNHLGGPYILASARGGGFGTIPTIGIPPASGAHHGVALGVAAGCIVLSRQWLEWDRPRHVPAAMRRVPWVHLTFPEMFYMSIIVVVVLQEAFAAPLSKR